MTTKRIPIATATAAAASLLATVRPASAQSLTHFGPENISTYGGAIDGLYYIIFLITGIAFVGVEAALVLFMVKYRRRPNVKARGDVEGNHTLELIWTSIPAVILFILAIAGQSTWAQIRNPENIPADAIPIEVSARQFAWDIRYAGADAKFGKTEVKFITEDNPFGIDPEDADGKDDVVMDSQMCVPVNKPVKVTVTSKDVIHSFFLPNLRIKQDAVPGMKVPIWFQATKTTAKARDKWKEEKARDFTIDELVAAVNKNVSINAAHAYKDKDGNVIVEADNLIIDEATVKAIQAAGNSKVHAYPEFDFQIVCAELCGNGHFKMKGTLLIETEEGFQKWLEENKPQ